MAPPRNLRLCYVQLYIYMYYIFSSEMNTVDIHTAVINKNFYKHTCCFLSALLIVLLITGIDSKRTKNVCVIVIFIEFFKIYI